jgi:deoxyadenosine/deoxycytidine kinase
MNFHYIAIEGPTGVGKTVVLERLAQMVEATTVTEECGENPFLKPFYEGRAGTAFQTEVFFLLSRFRRQQELLQRQLFSSVTLCDYVFEKSRLYSYLNLEDAELVIFEKLYGMLVESVPQPDLVVYLQASPERLAERVHQRGRAEDHAISEEYLQEICRAYNHYFFHYSRTPLLVVNTTELDLATRTDQVDDLIRQIEGMGKGTRYYVPLAESK